MPPNGNGVSVGVNANTTQAQRQIGGLSSGIQKLAANAKNFLGGNSAQQVTNYNRHLAQLERNLERVNMRLKGLQATQASLIQQQGKLAGMGNAASPAQTAQLSTVTKALQQNQNLINSWQARQLAAQTNVNLTRGGSVGGGGGGAIKTIMGLLGGGGGGAGGAGGMLGGLIGGAAGAAIGSVIGQVAGGVLKAVTGPLRNGFTSAVEEQKLFSDLMPRMRLGRMAGTSSQGFINNLRDMSMPLGFSGTEGLKVMSAVAPGSSDKGMMGDTQTAMQMARVFGLDAGGQGAMLGQAGTLGGFKPGQAKRFAEMLGRQIAITGLGPRAQEVQEATLMLMHRQLSTSATTSPGAAMALQAAFAKTGLPGFQGAQGAGVIGQVQSAVTGANSDAQIAFLEAVNRDQLGGKGYYSLRRLRDQGPLNNPKLLGAMFREAKQLSPHMDAAKDIMSGFGFTFPQLDALDKKTHGFKDMNRLPSIMKGLKFSNGTISGNVGEAMGQTGNQVRQVEATVSGAMARMGTPMVKAFASLGSAAAGELTALMSITDHSKNTEELLRQLRDHFLGKAGLNTYGGANPSFPTRENLTEWKKGVNGVPRVDLNGKRVMPTGIPTTFEHLSPEMQKRVGGPPILPDARGGSHQRSSTDLHIHVHTDPHGAIHHHAKLAFVDQVHDALHTIQRRETLGNVNRRYPRS